MPIQTAEPTPTPTASPYVSTFPREGIPTETLIIAGTLTVIVAVVLGVLVYFKKRKGSCE
jgi:hypothetical protein